MELTEEMLKYELPNNFKIDERDGWMATVDNRIHHYKGPCSGVLVDIGAHVGVVSTRAIMAGFNSIYCYEPCKANYSNLQFNLDLISGGEGDIHTHNLAVTNKTGESFTLYEANTRGFANSGMRSGCYIPQESVVDSVVSTISFQDVLRIHDHIELLKIDVEGGEFLLFEPSPELGWLMSRVKYLSLEIHHPDNSGIYNSKGFTNLHPWFSSSESAPMELIDYVRSLGFTDMEYSGVMQSKTLEFWSENHKLV